jgi:hypothetical protein
VIVGLVVAAITASVVRVRGWLRHEKGLPLDPGTQEAAVASLLIPAQGSAPAMGADRTVEVNAFMDTGQVTIRMGEGKPAPANNE